VFGLFLVIFRLLLGPSRDRLARAGAWAAGTLGAVEAFGPRWSPNALDHGPSPPLRRGGAWAAGPPRRGLPATTGRRRSAAGRAGPAPRPSRAAAALA
jgi:hypothetical protein